MSEPARSGPPPCRSRRFSPPARRRSSACRRRDRRRRGARAPSWSSSPRRSCPTTRIFRSSSRPALIGAEHLRLYEQAVVVPGPRRTCRGGGAQGRRGRGARRQRARPRHALQHPARLRRRRRAWCSSAARSRRPSTSGWSGARATARASRAVDTAVGRVGALACWEHYNPLARYALMAEHEEIHVAQFPGSLVGPIFAEQIEVTIRHHALETGCFVVNATGWLTEEQIASIAPDDRPATRRCAAAASPRSSRPKAAPRAAADRRRGHGRRRPRPRRSSPSASA